MTKTDKMMLNDTIAARRANCGYHINLMTCASCSHCDKEASFCTLQQFSVNQDRGVCDHFTLVSRRSK